MANDDKIIRQALEEFKTCEEAEEKNRTRYLDSLKFSLGDQWPETIRRARESDPNGARPCLTLDKVNQYVKQVVNDARQNRPSIKPRPVDDLADPEVAEVLQGVIRHIEDQSKADVSYDTAIEMATRGGFGYIRVMNDYAEDDGFEQDIFIKPVLNPLSCYMDPNAKELDGSDARYAFVFDDVPRDDFKAQYPKADPCDFETTRVSAKNWVNEKTIRVAEYFKVEDGARTVWQDENGQASEKEIEGAVFRSIKTRKVVWRKITAKEVLEEREFPSKWIGIVPVYGHVIWVGEEKRVSGLIWPAIDAQRVYNYSASAYVERVALVPKAPYLAPAKAVEGYERMWARANTSNQAFLPYNHIDEAGNPIPPPSRASTVDVPAGWLQAMQANEHDIQAALGMYQAAVGAPSNEKSGKAILAREHQADTATFHFTDNLSRAIRQVGRIVLDMLPRIYDTRRVIRILGEDSSVKVAQIEPDMSIPYKEERDERGKAIRQLFNPTLGKYDISVQVGPAYSTKRAEAADFLSNVTQSNPQMMQIVGDLMFKAMDVPYADEIAERLRKLLPPQLQEEQGDPAQQVGMLQGELQKAGTIITQLAQELQASQDQIQAAQSQAEERIIKAYDAETKRLEVLGSTLTPDMVQGLVVQTIRQILTSPPINEVGETPAMEVAETPGQQMQEMQGGQEMPPAGMPSGMPM